MEAPDNCILLGVDFSGAPYIQSHHKMEWKSDARLRRGGELGHTQLFFDT